MTTPTYEYDTEEEWRKAWFAGNATLLDHPDADWALRNGWKLAGAEDSQQNVGYTFWRKDKGERHNWLSPPVHLPNYRHDQWWYQVEGEGAESNLQYGRYFNTLQEGIDAERTRDYSGFQERRYGLPRSDNDIVQVEIPYDYQ